MVRLSKGNDQFFHEMVLRTCRWRQCLLMPYFHEPHSFSSNTKRCVWDFSWPTITDRNVHIFDRYFSRLAWYEQLPEKVVSLFCRFMLEYKW